VLKWKKVEVAVVHALQARDRPIEDQQSPGFPRTARRKPAELGVARSEADEGVRREALDATRTLQADRAASAP
jgi:hypothetical protein